MAQELRVNDRIRAREVRLVAPDGGQIGVKSIEEARWLAGQLSMDLVEVAPDARPPVVRMMDYGKFKYEQSVRQREARKKQSRTVVKEVKFRPQTDQHDYEWKKRRVIEFLEEGDKVKITVMFRGREVTHPEIGQRMMARLAEDVAEYAVVEQVGRLEGRNMSMSLAPIKRRQQDKKKAEVHEDDESTAGAEATDAVESADEEIAVEGAEIPDTAIAQAMTKKNEENEAGDQGDADAGSADGE